MNPQITELAEALVQVHIATGGGDVDRFRQVVYSLCGVAYINGRADGLMQFCSAIEAHEVLDRMKQGVRS